MTTRLAIISDVHADVHAVRDTLAQIERLGCNLVVCAGDLVDYGLFPEETIELLGQRKVPCIRGNHDRWAVARDRGEMRDTTGWGLSPRAIGFLGRMPLAWRATIEGVRVAVHHASVGSDMAGIYPDQLAADDARRALEAAGADVLLVGHTHIAFAIELFGGGLIANPGALLRDPAEPQESRAWIYDATSGRFARSSVPSGGTFGVLELPSKRFTVHRAADGSETRL
jgi:putative phosphoesterase